MTKVFFYHNAPERLAAAVSLIGRVARQKKSILVYAPDEALASALDRQLWIDPPTGFTPHVREHSPLAAETPVLIAGELDGRGLDGARFQRVLYLLNTSPVAQSLAMAACSAASISGRSQPLWYWRRSWRMS